MLKLSALPSDLWRSTPAQRLAAARHHYGDRIMTVAALTTGLWCDTILHDGTYGPRIYPGMSYPSPSDSE